MSLFQSSSHILLLSDELVVEILSFLTSGLDLFHCSLTCTKINRLVQDKKVLKNVSFRREIGVTASNFKQFFSSSSVCLKIQSINLNAIVWLNSSLLHSNLSKMKNLQELHIADVLFSSNQFSSLLSKLTRLQKLSFTWTWTTKEEADEVSKPSLSNTFSQLSSLNMYISTKDICPLDKITWMLQYCTGLEHLAIFTEILHKDVTYSNNRFNITVNIKDMKFMKLKNLMLDLKNRTYPGLLEREFVSKIVAGLDPANMDGFWCSSYWKREFLALPPGDDNNNSKLRLLTISTDYRHPSSLGSNTKQASLSFACEKHISDLLATPCPKLEKLTLQHLLPCQNKSEWPHHCSHSCHGFLSKIMKEHKGSLAGLKELSYRTNGFRDKDRDNKVDGVLHMETGQMLSSIKFLQLTKLALPLCGLLDSPDQTDDSAGMSSGMGKKRISHGVKKLNFSNNGFLEFASSLPGLEHLEILPCVSDQCSNAGAEGVLEAVPKLSKLKTLILVKVALNFTSKPLFQEIFSSCLSLEHLHLSSLTCDTQKFCRDLGLGLKKANSLKVLKVFQNQWTQFSKNLLEPVIEGCGLLEQMVLIDSSKAFTLKKFPLNDLIEIAKKDRLSFLYICSELLTIENIKKLKSEVKKSTNKKPFLISRFQKVFVRDKLAFYHLEDLSNLPMVFHRAVAGINSLTNSYCSTSTVGNVTIEDVF
eukprot:GFUD01017666.1.p1 GENE.GFUD01017666.1~~GFUD01017666.1.p1  ORF type:complete len:702 (+),score=167.71 GFUD01017666.1:80-2185(+)